METGINVSGMGLIVKDFVEDDCLLGTWEITEDFDTLYRGLQLIPEDENKLLGFKSGHRQLEWLSVRRLLQELTGDPTQRIVYSKERKPFLASGRYQISISHSYKYTSVLISKSKKVGLDLEYMSHRISNIAHKFINESEVISIDPKMQRYHLYIHWCAKEALYKICDKQDINFKKNLTIFPFEPESEGDIEGEVSNIHGHETFNLHYSRNGEYIMAWCAKDKQHLNEIFNFSLHEYLF